MKKNNIYYTTVKNNLCVSCGICSAVCPAKCIKFDFIEGQYIPVVDEERCIDCAKCNEVCSCHSSNYIKFNRNIEDKNKMYIGNIKSCYNVKSINKEILRNSTSGGAITTVISKLLEDEKYSYAFLIDDFNYSSFIETKMYKKGDDLLKTSKSRYIPVSHENTVEFMLKNRSEKIIIVGTSCVIQTILNVISIYKLNRDNYLFLGLFCDRNLNYNIFKYFSDFNENYELDNLFFRTKESNGWPGTVKLEYKEGQSVFLPAEERMLVKDYFQLQACLYCIDKLNQVSDISFGDNYTGQDTCKNGSSTIIVRSKLGQEILNNLRNEFEMNEVDIEKVLISQHINNRKDNLEFAKILNRNTGINKYPLIINNDEYEEKFVKYLKVKIEQINMGKIYPISKRKLKKEVSFLKTKKKIISKIAKIKRLL